MKTPVALLLALLLVGCDTSRRDMTEEVHRAHVEERYASDALEENIRTVTQKIEALEFAYANERRLRAFREKLSGNLSASRVTEIDEEEITASRAQTRKMEAALERWKQSKR